VRELFRSDEYEAEKDHIRGHRFRPYVTRLFDNRQYDLIENWFELWEQNGNQHDAWKKKSPRQRLTAIMKNIIANKGTFVPDNL
jgi:hypothetical protein